MIKKFFPTICLVIGLSVLKAETPTGNYVVTINFGTEKETVISEVSGNKPMTALDVLMRAAPVMTKPAGNFVLVAGIDSLQASAGKTAWYYKVNNSWAKVMACNNMLTPGDTVQWIYSTDKCTGKTKKKCPVVTEN